MDYRIIKQEAFRIVGVREPLLPDLEVYLDDGLSGESSFEVWLPVAKR